MTAPDRALVQVISGGQSGVDQAALECARRAGLATGGTGPPGLASENGADLRRYGLVPVDPAQSAAADPRAADAAYAQFEAEPELRRALFARTLRNVLDADATLVLTLGPPAEARGGTGLSIALARGYRRPLLCVDLGDPDAAARIAAWLARERVLVLNVAGPRESELRAHALAARPTEILARVLA